MIREFIRVFVWMKIKNRLRFALLMSDIRRCHETQPERARRVLLGLKANPHLPHHYRAWAKHVLRSLD